MVFKDLLVLEVSTVLAGPSVGMFFAELGARVIKVEHPEFGDVTRTWKIVGEDKNSTVSAYFSSVNFQKEYMQFDLSAEDEFQDFIDTLCQADILLTNFKKGDAEKFRLTDNLILKYNPRIIHGKINGFGAHSDRVAYDLILQAESGFMSMNGAENSEPTKIPVALIDVLAAHQLKEGILCALFERQQTNHGNVVEVSLYDAAISSLVNQASAYLMENNVPKRMGSKHPSIAPYGELFTTKDGATITFAIGSDKQFAKLVEFLGLYLFVTDPKFETNPVRVENRVELAEKLQEKIKLYDSKTLLDWALENFVPCGKIKTLDEVFADEQAKKLIREEVINGKQTKRVTSVAFKTRLPFGYDYEENKKSKKHH